MVLLRTLEDVQEFIETFDGQGIVVTDSELLAEAIINECEVDQK